MAGPAAKIHFEGRAEEIGDRAILRLPAPASAGLPSRGQVAVVGTINSHDLETVIEPDGRRGHWLSIDDSLRQALGLDDGASATLDLELADAWPEPEIPDDLRLAVSAAPKALETWNDITLMARWEWVRWVNATRSPQTRQRRVEVSVSKLQRGKRRPCCFDLASCTDPELSRSGRLIGVV